MVGGESACACTGGIAARGGGWGVVAGRRQVPRGAAVDACDLLLRAPCHDEGDLDGRELEVVDPILLQLAAWRDALASIGSTSRREGGWPYAWMHRSRPIRRCKRRRRCGVRIGRSIWSASVSLWSAPLARHVIQFPFLVLPF